MMDVTGWWWSTDGERFTSGPFSTRADAIAEADAELGHDETFWTARAVPVDTERLCRIDVDWLLEQVGERLYDEISDAGEDWPPSIDKEKKADLEKMLSGVFKSWVFENCPLSYFTCAEEQEHGPDDCQREGSRSDDG